MSYEQALTAAGATVHASEHFGSYQGEALADLTYEGRRGILSFGFGSCSGCDSWEAFEGYGDNESCPDHKYEYNSSVTDRCVLCGVAKALWQSRVADFGRDMLNGVMFTTAELARYREQLVEQTEWDHDAQAQLRWFDEHVWFADDGHGLTWVPKR